MLDVKTWTVGSAIGLLIVGSFIFSIALMFFHALPDNPNVQPALTCLQTLAVMVVGFFYGSSTSSKTKDDTIAKLSNGNGAPKP